MRYNLRTLLILLAILPPLIAGAWWKYSAWRAEQERRALIELEGCVVIGVPINNWGRLRPPQFRLTPQEQSAIDAWIDPNPSSREN